MHCFKLSAPGKIVAEHFRFDPAQIIAAAKEQMARHASR
jgi:transketolase